MAPKSSTKPSHPFLSVIVPCRDGSKVLPQSLAALAASDFPREYWELIVVDDSSHDDTAAVAAAWADTIVRLSGRAHGPAYARNRGVEVSRGDCVVFIDADVCVHTDTLRQFAQVFVQEPDVSAIFGSYDSTPADPGIISQYRNLLHHYVHQMSAGDAETFWAGCGAVRREVFIQAGMYDEWHYSKPQIEDIELGHRIRALGHRIQLRPEIQAKHLKRWTLRNVILTDLHDRGVPWMRLLVQQGQAVKSKSLNLRTIEKLNTVSMWVSSIALVAAMVLREWWPASIALVGSMFVITINRSLYSFFERERGMGFALSCIPLHLMYYLINGVAAGFGWLLHLTVGEPRPSPIVEAYSEVGLQTWPPVPRKSTNDAWLTPVSSSTISPE
jgi:glycosyltransferase involved in cell wall biosynthesis